MFYAIRHFTRYRYSAPVWETVMEVRMHPRTDHRQRCFTFQLSVSPRARIFSYIGHLGNAVYHFDIPERHSSLTIITDALVEVDPPPACPDSIGSNGWRELDSMIEHEDFWDMLMPGQFARSSPELQAFAREIGADERRGDLLELIREINLQLNARFAYVRESTRVDSPIEHALASRQGVCQDFAHIMIALLRNLRIPSRYVSGYLYEPSKRPDHSGDGATHAWVEALLPGLGWIGFDPTHNALAGEGHIRTASGCDYAEVPPAMGTMKGFAKTELQVRVRVTPSDALLPPERELASDEEWSRFLEEDRQEQALSAQQQRQQQQ